MSYAGLIISLVVIVIVARLLLKKYHPHAVLLLAGIFMLILAGLFDFTLPTLKKPTGFDGFDLFAYLKESFADTNSGVGLMIMAIGGFVAYIDKIEASAVLVKLALKPLALLKKYPHLSAVMVLPIGQMLFVCIPSAAGLGLLLMASVFPILRGLGVSRISAVSVIAACTAFGIGPASAITASAVQIAQAESVPYFINNQIPLVWPLTLVLMVSYYFVNRYFDNKEEIAHPHANDPEVKETKAPAVYALIPLIPLVLLIIFSGIIPFFGTGIKLDTTTAMLISFFIAVVFEAIRTRDVKLVLNSFKIFWDGMGNIFKTVVTLIIAADIFAQGLISLGFIDNLVFISQSVGLGAVGMGVVLTFIIFLASMLMGSGNAAFFAFAPLVPNIAAKFGVKSASIILPMNLAASMGRTVSPVAGVLIAIAEIAGVTSLDIVKRNIIPFSIAFLVMLLYHFTLCF
ncbi:MAG: C4-dicarboxylate transporter DcuC [Bacteroidota bacterium]|jgi:DcuC family C4-dicarboxylate transporter